MAITKLNLTPDYQNPYARTKGVNFGEKNQVEHFLEGRQFRTACTNLECSEVRPDRDQVLYMPVCAQNRFLREGPIAPFTDMPEPGHGLSPVTYTTIPYWAAGIGCPLDCRGFKHRNVVKAQKMLAVLHPREWINAAVWAWIVNWKIWIMIGGGLLAILMKWLVG